jgi:hypothetical protein
LCVAFLRFYLFKFRFEIISANTFFDGIRILSLALTFCVSSSRRQLEREQGKNRMLAARLKQQGFWDDDTICSEDHVDLPAVPKADPCLPLPELSSLPALRNVPRMLNLGSSFDSSSLNSSSSSSGGSSSSCYYLAASPTSSVLARKRSRQGKPEVRPGSTSRPGTADYQLMNLGSTPSPPLGDNPDQVRQIYETFLQQQIFTGVLYIIYIFF